MFMRLILALIIMMYSGMALSQTLRMGKSVEIVPHNIYASKNPRMDSNGQACGVLLIHSTLKDLKFYGQIEGDVKFEAGVYYIYLHQNSTKLTIKQSDGSKLNIKIPKIQSKTTYQATIFESEERGYLICSSDPSGANVTLISPKDRIEIGKTPLKGNVEILEGNYDIEISKKGFVPEIIKNIKIKSNKTTKIGTIKLKKL